MERHTLPAIRPAVSPNSLEYFRVLEAVAECLELRRNGYRVQRRNPVWTRVRRERQWFDWEGLRYRRGSVASGASTADATAGCGRIRCRNCAPPASARHRPLFHAEDGLARF